MKMNRRDFLKVVGTVPVMLATPSFASTERIPNLDSSKYFPFSKSMVEELSQVTFKHPGRFGLRNWHSGMLRIRKFAERRNKGALCVLKVGETCPHAILFQSDVVVQLTGNGLEAIIIKDRFNGERGKLVKLI